MKNLLLAFMLLATTILNAQLTDGSIAPDFTLQDIDGNTHQLYNYLNEGKIVFIDFWAAHCPSCWSYHLQEHIENLFLQHGISGSESQDVIVLGIEVDAGNGLNELQGVSGNTQGNWLAGISYPVFNPEGAERTVLLNNWEVNYYPLVYCICPDGSVTVTGTQTKEVLYEEVILCNASVNVESEVHVQDIIFNFSPQTSTLQLNESSQGTHVEVHDLTGQLITEGTTSGGKFSLSLSGISSGIYFCRFTDAGGKSFTGKFFKE
ncbi:MAG: T9SS type A sorting domain-containing protein [Flavobacteriales bacterium]|nr:T9SS type A sorting domain-containing protein [Flavobacteriales bacterium]